MPIDFLSLSSGRKKKKNNLIDFRSLTKGLPEIEKSIKKEKEDRQIIGLGLNDGANIRTSTPSIIGEERKGGDFLEIPLIEEKKVMVIKKAQEDLDLKRQLAEERTPRFTRNLKTGALSSAGSTVRGFEWLAPDSLKPSLSGIAQDIESNVDILAVENPTFLDNLTQGAGSTATFFIPGVGIAKGVSALGMTGKAALYFGGSLSTALEATSEAGGVYQELRDSGKSDEEASKAATETFWANAVVIGLTNHLGPFSDKIKSNLKRGIISSLTEGGQEGIQTIISNIETGKPVLEGVKDSVLIGAILGGPTGFVGGENLTGVDPNTMKRMIEENYTDGTPPEGTSGAVIKTDPIINPINFKEINKKVENNLAEEQVTINSIQLGDDFSVADKDVSTGRKSVTKQPVLLGRDETGIYVKDGNHRIAEAMRSGENNITATFNEQAYRKLTEDVKEIKEKVESILKKDAVKIEDFAEFGDKLIEKFPEADLGEGEIDFTKTDISEDIIERSTFNNEPSLEEIHSILREKPKPIKEQKAESEILEEFEIAEAGKRIQTDDRTKPIVQKSTFPQWIPSELRRKTLLNAVKQHILNNTVPIKVAEKRLYDITKKRIAEKSAPKDAKPKKKKVSEKEINVSKIQFEQISPTKQESKAGVSSGSYYASKGEFSPIDIPNHVTNIEMPEMISLYKTLLKGEVPFLRKFPSAWGAFYSDPNNPRIAISPKAFESEDSNQAVKTLAHEIGHLIDFLPDMNINKGNLLNRLESLVKIRKGIIGSEEVIKKRKNIMSNISKLNNIEKKEGGLDFNESKDRENAIENLNKINKELIFDEEYRKELKELSQFWKPFDRKKNNNYTNYRDSAPELYADFISVLFNRPDLAMTKAPKFWKRFFEFIENKPDVKKAYFELSEFLTGKKEDILDKREADIRKGFQTAAELEVNKMGENLGMSVKERASNMARELNIAFIEKNTPLIEKVEQKIKEGVTVKPEDNPAILLEELDLIKNEISNVYDNVEKIDTRITKENLTDIDFSTYLFYKRVTGDRAKKANPYGHTPKTAQDGLDRMKEKIGKEKFETLEKSAKELNELMDKEMQDGADAGLYTQELVDELQNGDNIYATFKILDYVLSGSVSANVMAQVGTFKDLGQTYQSTIAKMVAVRVAAHRNNFKKISGEFFLDNFNANEVLDANIPAFTNAEILKAKIDPRTGGAAQFKNNKNQVKLELITWRDEGKLKGVYVDPYIARSFKYDSNVNNNLVRETIGLVNNKVFRKAYIDYSIRFIVRNPIRDLRQAWKALSFKDLQGTGEFKTNFIDFVKHIKQAYPEARSFAKGEKTETIEKILDKKILGVDEDYTMNKADLDDSTAISREMKKRGLKMEQIEKGKASKNPFVHIGNFIMQVGKTSEAITKILAYQAIEEQLNMRETKVNKETAQYIRNNIGTPNWKKGGTKTPTTNSIFMFSNVALQGYKRTFGEKGTFRDPNTKSGYMWRSAQIAVLPKILMYLAANGLMGDDLEELYARISTYKKKNYLVVPIGSHNNKTVAFSLPMDYDERLYTAIMWTVMDSIKNKSVDGSDLWNLITGEMPALTNTIALPLKWSEYFGGINPRDNWTGRNVLTDNEFKAGGAESLSPMVKWTFNQVLSGIFKLDIREKYKNLSIVEKIANLPLINAFVSVDDYGLQEEITKERKELDRSQAKEKLKKDKIIIDKIREFYKSGDDAVKIDEYIGKAMHENFKGKIVASSDESSFRKSFMREYFKTMNSSYVTSLIYSNTIDQQVSALKIIEENTDKKTFNEIKSLFLNARLISENTWNIAMEEIRKEKQ